MKKYRLKMIFILGLIIISFSFMGCTPITTSVIDSKINNISLSNMKTVSKNTEKLKVYYFDVGQGDSIYLKLPNGEDILIDGGDNSHGDDVVKYLKDLQVDDLEAIISTHPDADHSGGLDIVLQNFKVKSVYAPKVNHDTQTFLDFVAEVKNQKLKIKPIKSGLKLPFDSVDTVFVSPVEEYGSNLNDWSAVLKLSFKDTSFLFTGDATIKSEKDMINSKQDLTADVLKLGHHGSDTSSSNAFLKAVNPKYAIISVGKKNRYGHPKKSVIEQINKLKIDIYRTDKNGTIVVTSDGKNITFETSK